ncbi:beta strand repeat-containing protein [Myroides phaeus]|uniref:beta strand repeat-containing protein n=1 Tax=Myroides phaeus TaxID=702745 RepID=UPI001303CA4B|nr:hypothetical protein [Myroides phaeus]
MNKKLLSIACLMGTFSIYAQVGIGTKIPNKSAELAVVSDKRGLLIPNVSLKSKTDITTIQAGNIESLLVYNTNKTDQLSIGYYYWHNNLWNKLLVEKDIPELVINYFEEITQGGDVTNIIKNIVRKTEGNVFYENGKFYYINVNGDRVEIDFSNIHFNETLTILKYDATNGLLTYTNEKGQVVTIDIKASVKAFETLTKIVQDIDKGTITFYDENGDSTVLLIADFVQKYETETTLVRNSPGNYSYTNEKNVVTEITVIGDFVEVINNKLDQLLYQTLKNFVDLEETVTKLEYNASTKMLVYTDEDRQLHNIDITQIVKDNQDITRIDSSNSKNITVSSIQSGNILTYVLEVNAATTSDLGVVKPGSGLIVDEYGALSVDVTTILNGKHLSGNEKIVVTNGAGSVLKEVSLDINEAKLSLQNIGGVLNLNQLYSGNSGDILFVDASGNVVWSALETVTSNKLTLNQAELSSNVNGVLSSVSLVDKISNEMIQSRAVTQEKLGALESQVSMVPVVQIDGSVKYQKINEEQIEGKLLESANNLLTVTSGVGSILKDVTLTVNQSNFELNKIGGTLSISKIEAGQNNTVLITNNTGNVEWVDQNSLVPTTTNALGLAGNTLTSTVNNISSSVDLDESNVISSKAITGTGITVDGGAGASLTDVSLKITPGAEEQVLITRNNATEWVDQNSLTPTTTNALGLTGNTLTSTVNNISSSVDLDESNVISSKAITGTGITVDGGAGASLTDVSLKITPGAEEQVLITRNNATEWVDHNSLVPTTTNALGLTGNTLTSTVNNILSSVDLDESNVISSKAITGTGITVDGGAGASLTDVSLKITPGAEEQVLITRNNATEWVDQNSLTPTTTNALGLTGNTLTSTVNNISSSVDLDESNVISSKAITGTGITVDGGAGASLTDVSLKITPGAEEQVLITRNNATEWVDQNSLTPTTTNALGLAGNKLTSTVNNISSSVDLDESNVISSKAITGTGITVDGGAGASLTDVSLKITPGAEEQVLITRNNATEWVDQNSLVPTTTNALGLAGNTLTSTVNNISSSVDLDESNVISSKAITGTGITVDGGAGASLTDVSLKITPGAEEQVLITRNNATEWVDQNSLTPTTTNALGLAGNKLTSTVNNISSSVDLDESNVISSKAITGTGITVDGGAGASLTDVSLKITPGAEEQVLITRNNATEWVDQNSLVPTTTNALGLAGNTLTSTVNNISSSVDLDESNVISSKAITGTGITVDGGAGASLTDVSLKITPGAEEQVLITRNNATEWVDQNSLTPTTTNALGLAGNKLTSTVNNISSSVDLDESNVISSKAITGTGITVDGGAGASLTDVSLKITPGAEEQVLITRNNATEWVDQNSLVPTTTNALGLAGNTLTSTVNNISSSIDLEDVIQGAQNTYAVIDGVNTTVVSTTTAKHTDYSVNVSKNAIQNAQKISEVIAGNGVLVNSAVVDDTTSYTVAVDPSSIQLIGDVTGPLNSNKVVAIQNENVSATTPLNKQVLIYDGALQEWTPATPQVNVDDILDGKALTSTDLELSTNAPTALLKAVTANIKTGAVTSDKILDGTILPIDIAKAGSLEALITDSTGMPKWSSQQTLVQDNQKISHVAAGENVNVVESYLDNTTTYTIDVKSALPKFFYMPSVLIPTAEGQSSQNGVTYSNATRKGSINLYEIYNTQFSTPVLSSRSGVTLPVIDVADLDFIITYIDSSVFFNLQLTEQGLLTYEVRSTANVTNGSFMNIVFSIR